MHYFQAVQRSTGLFLAVAICRASRIVQIWTSRHCKPAFGVRQNPAQMALGSLLLVVAFSMYSFIGESFECLHVNCSDGSAD